MSEQTPTRPYDPNQLERLTKHMIEHGTVLNPPSAPPETSVVHEPGFEHYPTKIESAKTAFFGLRRFITTEGRLERARELEQRIEKRNKIAGWLGDRINNPRQTSNPAEKIGWLGTSKRFTGDDPRSEDLVNLGHQLFRKKFEPQEPNLNRPVTRSERAADRRLEKWREKRNQAWLKSRWYDSSYGQSMSRGVHRLSRSEQRHMSKTSHRIEKLDKKTAKAERKFNNVAASNDYRGSINRWRLGRVQGRIENLESKQASREARREQRAERSEERRQRRDSRPSPTAQDRLRNMRAPDSPSKTQFFDQDKLGPWED